ncbi:hypothetical protein VRC24_02410 [Pseudomonas poae]|nr:hypothetical protein [Pseudomonas poae]
MTNDLQLASSGTFLEKPVAPARPSTIKHADAKKPGISRLPHHTPVF